MNVKKAITDYAATPQGQKVINRPEGSIWTGKTHKESFYKLKNGGKIVIEQKDVRETTWRSTALARALLKAAQA